MRILAGDYLSYVSGIRTSPNTAPISVTAYSLTGSRENFANLTVEISNKTTGANEKLVFTDNGSLDTINSTGSELIEFSSIEENKFNLQFFVLNTEDYDIYVWGKNSKEFDLITYVTGDSVITDTLSYGKIHGQGQLLRITSTKGIQKVYTDNMEVKGHPLR